MPTEADAFWDAMIKYSQALEEQRVLRQAVAKEKRKARQEELRVARNARRRARYASTPRPAPRPAEPDDPDLGLGSECSCHTSPMPPCGWCENGGGADDSDEL